ncbi:hypothetical protein PRIPAC_84980 [Pristionchus pacificus]|uniref:LITAF domain-containing protein n=1 Tax=Pristionchus pacificus TaxID=54126 RepID=A0A2A6BM46_PRIPA|nr:hypothetical protein PRIPAC_84980 [Pristionchus pacificus]|eukprot:PDM67012.1 hypothetical protein PRIPAC_48429 [Pristionchus pacificus]
MADPEKSGPPPAYDSPPAYSPPPTIPVAAQVAAVPMAAPAAAEQRHTAIPIFITARTNVYGVNPVEMDCPHCNAHVVTHIERTAGALTWLIVGICFFLGFFLAFIPWCLCCIPFCADSCLDVLHFCPSCRRALGRYKRM